MIEWHMVLLLVIGAFGFGYGFASREVRKELDYLYSELEKNG